MVVSKIEEMIIFSPSVKGMIYCRILYTMAWLLVIRKFIRASFFLGVLNGLRPTKWWICSRGLPWHGWLLNFSEICGFWFGLEIVVQTGEILVELYKFIFLAGGVKCRGRNF